MKDIRKNRSYARFVAYSRLQNKQGELQLCGAMPRTRLSGTGSWFSTIRGRIPRLQCDIPFFGDFFCLFVFVLFPHLAGNSEGKHQQ